MKILLQKPGPGGDTFEEKKWREEVTLLSKKVIQMESAVAKVPGVLNYTGTMGNSSKAPQTVAPDDWVEIKIAGTIYYIPAYLA